MSMIIAFSVEGILVKMMNNTPKLVGIWVVGITPEQDMITWGIDGDSIYPFPNNKDAEDQVSYLMSSITHKNDRFYLMHVFNNGQIKLYETV